jgi:hypothetical protein
MQAVFSFKEIYGLIIAIISKEDKSNSIETKKQPSTRGEFQYGYCCKKDAKY